jgi:hypothetical protein
MRLCGSKQKVDDGRGVRSSWRAFSVLGVLTLSALGSADAQTANPATVPQQIQDLTAAMARTQAQLEQSQRQLDEMRQQLTALQRQFADAHPAAQSSTAGDPASSSPAQAASTSTESAIEDIRERQALQETQIATQEQAKVESESKYPVKVTGLLLLNGFVNTSAVDIAATPTLATAGPGSTGASVRQTILGIDARGPHLFGASSSADLRVDFDGMAPGNTTLANYTGFYSNNTSFVRLRTMHAALNWDHTEAYFALDRPLFSPDTPSSLTAVAEPALAWSGNLWTWNPQLGLTQDVGLGGAENLRLQAALIDVGDAPASPTTNPFAVPTGVTPSGAEQSRWPGVEARIALLGEKQEEDGNHFGVGGYFSPHRIATGQSFDAWAGTLDGRLSLPGRLAVKSSFYRGLALGGLGGGTYKDFAYYADTDAGKYYFRPLDDVGGWVQLSEKLNERIELNGAFGLDESFAHQLRRFASPSAGAYQNLARNRTYTGNVIYSPSAYLLFSLEYRHLMSSPVVGSSASSNIVGIAAGYKF